MVQYKITSEIDRQVLYQVREIIKPPASQSGIPVSDALESDGSSRSSVTIYSALDRQQTVDRAFEFADSRGSFEKMKN